jgi:hypothetical protein
MTIKERLKKLEEKVAVLEKDSHPPRDFVKRIELDLFKQNMAQMNRILLQNAQKNQEVPLDMSVPT